MNIIKKSRSKILISEDQTEPEEIITTKKDDIKKDLKFNNLFKNYNMPLTLEEELKKNDIRDAPLQSKPFNINRNLLLLIYFLLIVITNRLFFGWPNLSNLLFRDKAYIWKCKKNGNGEYEKVDPTKRYYCIEQDAAVQNIFIVGSAAYFTFSFINGIITDTLGSRLSMLIGHSANYLGWFLLLMSNENFDAYLVGAVLIAASIDLGSFSTLNISALYPKSENLVVNIISGAGSLATATMMLLDLVITQLDADFKTFMFIYISLTIGVFFLLTIFLFPRTRFFRQYEFDNYYENKELMDLNKDQSIIGEELKSKDKTSLRKTSFSIKDEHSHDLEKNAAKTNDTDDDDSSQKRKSVFATFFKSQRFIDLFRICTCPHFICLWIYGPLNALYNTFYYSVVENILSKEKNDMFGILLSFSLIPCIILGKISDILGVMVIFYYELTSAVFMYATSFGNNDFLQWVSIIAGTLYSACANGQLWTFISCTFSSKYHSTLIGILNFVNGIISLSRVLLVHWAKNENYNFTNVNIFILCLIGVNIIVTIILIFIRKYRGKKIAIGD